MAKSELAWTTLDVATLSEMDQTNYTAYKTAYAAMKKARLDFEQGMQRHDKPNGMRFVFGYNFGKLSIAIAPDDAKPAKSTTGTQSLADWIATQRASGRNS